MNFAETAMGVLNVKHLLFRRLYDNFLKLSTVNVARIRLSLHLISYYYYIEYKKLYFSKV